MREPLNKWPLTSAVTLRDLDSGSIEDMPKLKSDIGNAVFYLYRINPKTGKRTGPHGSGFIVGRKSTTIQNLNHYYGVTNWHLSNDLGASIIQINTDDGKSRFSITRLRIGFFEKNGDDLSIVDLTDEAKTGDQLLITPMAALWMLRQLRASIWIGRRCIYDWFIC